VQTASVEGVVDPVEGLAVGGEIRLFELPWRAEGLVFARGELEHVQTSGCHVVGVRAHVGQVALVVGDGEAQRVFGQRRGERARLAAVGLHDVDTEAPVPAGGGEVEVRAVPREAGAGVAAGCVGEGPRLAGGEVEGQELVRLGKHHVTAGVGQVLRQAQGGRLLLLGRAGAFVGFDPLGVGANRALLGGGLGRAGGLRGRSIRGRRGLGRCGWRQRRGGRRGRRGEGGRRGRRCALREGWGHGRAVAARQEEQADWQTRSAK
jgi:hypothetical protein